MLRKILTFVLLLSTVSLSQQTHVLSGVVLDSLDQTPIEHASLSLPGLHLQSTSDKSGRFSFQQIPAGSYILTASAPGYEPVSMTVSTENPSTRVFLTRRIFKLSPITVTAQLASNRHASITYSDLSASLIKNQYLIQDVPVLLSQLPSVTEYSENGSATGYTYITMRGFDQRRISVMVNGIPQNDPEDHNVYWIDVPDLQANAQIIQVQRGAGNEFYGPPAIGGSINILTSNLSSHPGISLSAGLGSTGSNGFVRRYSITASSGLIADRYSVYAHLSKISNDGYRESSWDNYNSYYFSLVRTDPEFTTQFDVYGGPISDGLSYLGLPKFAALDKNLRTSNWADWNYDSSYVNYSPHMKRFISSDGIDTVYAVPRRPTEIENFSQPHYELINEWHLSPSVTLNNSLFLMRGYGFFDYDGSWGDTTFFRLTSKYGFNPAQNPTDALIHAYVDITQFGWLPRVSATLNNGDLTIGGEFRRNLSYHWGSIRWADNLPANVSADYRFYEYRVRTDMASIYSHGTSNLTKNLSLRIDLEYAFKQYYFYGEKFVGNTFTVPYHFFNPRIGLNYDLSSQSNIYFTVNRTSHEPRLISLYNADESSAGATPNFGMNKDSTLNFGDPLVKPETLYDLELGYRFNSEDLTLSISGYWMEFFDELVSNGKLDQYGMPITGNASRTRHVGLEIESSYMLLKDFSLYGNLTLSSNKLIRYTVYSDAYGNTVPGGISLDGNTIGGFPSLIGNVRVTYSHNSFSTSLLGQYIGPQYSDNYDLAERKISSYFIINAWVSYQITNIPFLSGLTVKAYVNNILDKMYIAHGEGEYFYPAAGRTYFLNVALNL
ncbi:MAG: TonB-dependent receptor [Candidatus Kryptoniota bacterium]